MQSNISPDWILLDNQSTVDIIHNDTILKNMYGYVDVLLV